MKQEIFNTPDYGGCGIYAIVNSQKMICYIGSSRNIKRRAINHKTHLRQGKHSNKLLQKDYENKSVFRFVVLCKLEDDVEDDFLIAIEKMYMLSAMDNYFDVYNLLPKTRWNKQKDWIYAHLIHYFLSKNNVSKNFVKAFSEEYGTTPAYMHNRKPENRN